MDAHSLLQAMEDARQSIFLGDAPQELLTLVSDAMAIVAPDEDAGAEREAALICLIAMNLTADIRAAYQHIREAA